MTLSSSSSSSYSTPRIHISMPRQQQQGMPSSSMAAFGDQEPRIRRPEQHLQQSHTTTTHSSDDDDEEHEFDMQIESAVDSPDNIGETVHPSHMTPSRKTSSPTASLWEGLRNQNLDFPINTECTSLSLSPSGNFLWAGFSDGTLRVFDLSGRFSMESDNVEPSQQKSSMLVNSKFHQRFGAVACQIHARGVHTDLLTQVDVCGDYVFGGVPRGAIELYAVSIRELEDQVHRDSNKNVLDYIHVHVHADAKLKGFGACTQLQHASRPTYLLLTGKGIKNIHIWRFQPPLVGEEDAIWDQLYDTQTNGNTIHLLSFYRNPLGKLFGVSQSDTQKLRLWDLSHEEDPEAKKRPKRPAYQDVANSQGALGIAGGYGVCGGPTMYNQFSIVSLDQPKSAYNHTELALPGSIEGIASGGRQRRGDLKQLVNVATLMNDSNHALLELDDGSIVHYIATDPRAGRPNLEILTEESTGIGALPADFWVRTLCLGKPAGVVVAAAGVYNPNTQLGHIEVRALQPVPPSSPVATDSRALSRLCMQAPPPSSVKKLKKKKKKRPMEDSLPEKSTCKNDSTMMTTPSRVAVQDSTMNVATVAVPISAEPSMKKLKKKMKIEFSNNRGGTGAVIPPSVEKVPGVTQVAAAKQSKETSAENVSPSQTDCESFSFQTRKIVPLSGSKSQDRSVKPVAKPKTNATTMPPQVSPSMATPSSDVQEGTPSSNDSPQEQGQRDIAKFLKPKRVLHNWSDKTQTSESLAKLPSPPVPRKVRKSSDESKSSKTSGSKADRRASNESSSGAVSSKSDKNKNSSRRDELTEPGLSLATDPSRLEFKVRQTLKIQSSAIAAVNESKLSANTSLPSTLQEPTTKKPIEIPIEGDSCMTTPQSSNKRQKLDPSEENALASVASLLIDMKSPTFPSARSQPSAHSSAASLNREDAILMQARQHYQKLQAHIAAFPKSRSRLLTQTPNSFGSLPSQSRKAQVVQEHRAAQEMIQKRLLRSAEFTLRSLLDNQISVESARNDLKESIRSFEEVLHDTLKRQELEVDALVDKRGPPPKMPGWSFRSAFDVVNDIKQSLEQPKRAPGRPKA